MNAVIYARYSSYGQTEQSIEGQLRDCYSYAEREGLTIVGEYIDRAMTGRYDDRPDFQKMIADSKKGQFDRVIVWKLDRFARNRYDSATYKHRLKKNNVKVLSAMENIGEGDESIILEAVLEASAEYYSKDLSKKVKRGFRENKLKGLCTGGTPLYGYQYVDKKPVINPNTAPTIQYLFEEYAKGVSKKEIIDTLNARGARSSTGKPLTYTSFQKAMRNRKYLGENIVEGVDLANYPQLIEEDVFNKVQERLDQNMRSPGAKKAKVEYYLQGKAFCGMCGAPMVGESGSGRNKVTYNYYACADKKKKHTCHKKNEKKDFLEWYVVEQTVAYVLIPSKLEYIAEAVVNQYHDDFNVSKIKEMENSILRLENEMNRAIDAMIATSSIPVRERLTEKIDLFEMQRSELEVDLAKLKIASEIKFTVPEIIAWLQNFCQGDIMDEEYRKRIIDVFINSIFVYDDKVVVFYNIKGGKQISHIEATSSLDNATYNNDVFSQQEMFRISNAQPSQVKSKQSLLRLFSFFFSKIEYNRIIVFFHKRN